MVISSHHLLDLNSAIVAPALSDSHRRLSALEVEVDIAGETLILAIAELFSVQLRVLATPAGSLLHYEDAIRRALDRLFSGF